MSTPSYQAISGMIICQIVAGLLATNFIVHTGLMNAAISAMIALAAGITFCICYAMDSPNEAAISLSKHAFMTPVAYMAVILILYAYVQVKPGL